MKLLIEMRTQKSFQFRVTIFFVFDSSGWNVIKLVHIYEIHFCITRLSMSYARTHTHTHTHHAPTHLYTRILMQRSLKWAKITAGCEGCACVCVGVCVVCVCRCMCMRLRELSLYLACLYSLNCLQFGQAISVFKVKLLVHWETKRKIEKEKELS